MTEETLAPGSEAVGLRGRKKAQRRDEIIAAAQDLFARQGIDATTMADIADAVGVSPPTVFNYFGSKDGVLIALISEGTRNAREADQHVPLPASLGMGDRIVAFFLRVSTRTLEIAGKRVWRYAEAAAIRHPETELARQYTEVSGNLMLAITEFFEDSNLTIRAGGPCPSDYLARLFHDLWMPCFIELIKQDALTLAEHEAQLRSRLLPLVGLILSPDAATSKTTKHA